MIPTFLRWLVHRGENDEIAARALAATEHVADEATKFRTALAYAREHDPLEKLFIDLRGSHHPG